MPSESLPERTYTDRGFAVFAQVPYEHDHRCQEIVSVYESSSAEVDAVWLSVSGRAILRGYPDALAGTIHGTAPADNAAHLTLDQARAVRDALSVWIAEAEARRAASSEEADGA